MSLYSKKGGEKKMIAENTAAVMKRYELKYIVTAEQEELFKKRLGGRMVPDRFGLTSIATLYYDTPDRRLINASLEKPEFKEKIRLRSYGLADDDTPVYLEIKRKIGGVVCKRRVRTTVLRAQRFFDGENTPDESCQIGRELEYFRDYHAPLFPSCLVIYDRTAFFEPGGDLRITLDNDPRYRTELLDLRVSMEGFPLLPEGCSVLEIKVQEAVPLWLSHILDELKIYRHGFSKYGEAYKNQMKKQFAEVLL